MLRARPAAAHVAGYQPAELDDDDGDPAQESQPARTGRTPPADRRCAAGTGCGRRRCRAIREHVMVLGERVVRELEQMEQDRSSKPGEELHGTTAGQDRAGDRREPGNRPRHRRNRRRRRRRRGGELHQQPGQGRGGRGGHPRAGPQGDRRPGRCLQPRAGRGDGRRPSPTDLGPIDVLVNNAGIESIVPFLELDDAEWERVTNINLQAVRGRSARSSPATWSRAAARARSSTSARSRPAWSSRAAPTTPQPSAASRP